MHGSIKLKVNAIETKEKDHKPQNKEASHKHGMTHPIHNREESETLEKLESTPRTL